MESKVNKEIYSNKTLSSYLYHEKTKRERELEEGQKTIRTVVVELFLEHRHHRQFQRQIQLLDHSNRPIDPLPIEEKLYNDGLFTDGRSIFVLVKTISFWSDVIGDQYSDDKTVDGNNTSHDYGNDTFHDKLRSHDGHGGNTTARFRCTISGTKC